MFWVLSDWSSSPRDGAPEEIVIGDDVTDKVGGVSPARDR